MFGKMVGYLRCLFVDIISAVTFDGVVGSPAEESPEVFGEHGVLAGLGSGDLGLE